MTTWNCKAWYKPSHSCINRQIYTLDTATICKFKSKLLLLSKFVTLTFISISFLNYFLSPFSLYHTLSSSSSTSSPFPPHLIIPLYKYSFSVVAFLNHLVLCALDIIVAHYCSTCFLYLKHMSYITIYNNVACPSLLDA